MDGTPKQVFKNVQQLRQLGLDVPETTDILYRLRQQGYDVPLDALSVEQCAQAIYAQFGPQDKDGMVNL
jgi:energy-coupling factor transport system ATP-binding protein